MFESFAAAPGGWLPFGYCLSWDPILVWTIAIAEVAIGLACFSIPAALFYCFGRAWDKRFGRFPALFGMFMLACGSIHWIGMIDIWYPVYRLDAVGLVFTAGIAVATATVLWYLAPKALRTLEIGTEAQRERDRTNLRLADSLRLLEQQNAEAFASEHRFRLTLKNAPNGLCLVGLDGRFIMVNQALCSMLGYTEAELLARTFQDITHPEDLQQDLRHVADLIAGRGDNYRMEKRYLTKARTVIRIQLDVSILRDDHGAPVHFISQIEDITEREATRAALLDSQRRLEAGYAQLERQNYRISLLSELSGVLLACQGIDEIKAPLCHFGNAMFAGFSGAVYLLHNSHSYLEQAVAFGGPLASDLVFTPDTCWALRRGQHHWNGHDSMRCPHVVLDVQDRPTLCTPIVAHGERIGLLYLEANAAAEAAPAGANGQVEHIASMVADRVGAVVANIQLRETLRRQAMRDGLTGMFNRRFLEESLPRELSLAARHEYPICLMMIDVDHFKAFNDRYGHDAGDKALQMVATEISRQFRDSDIACRYGGEEFSVVLPNADLDIAHQRAERLSAQIARLEPVGSAKALGPVTISVGIATFPAHGTTPAALLEKADAALYQAKRAGRNRVVCSGDAPDGRGET
jgi:diguanylate cyclase (GGDEF)-like protein/PAS domain S-box-containing protein